MLPIEQRNFSNVLEILRMNNLDEHADATEETDFDRLFMALGDANPASYAYHQYLTFKKAPAKTALNILISTAVLISQYVDIPEFNNLTYKDALKETDETKSKEQLAREMAERENVPKMESSDVLQKFKVNQMQILDSYSPTYEFD